MGLARPTEPPSDGGEALGEIDGGSALRGGSGGAEEEACSGGAFDFVVDVVEPDGLEEEGVGAGGDFGLGAEVPALDDSREDDGGDGLRRGQVAEGVAEGEGGLAGGRAWFRLVREFDPPELAVVVDGRRAVGGDGALVGVELGGVDVPDGDLVVCGSPGEGAGGDGASGVFVDEGAVLGGGQLGG